MASFGVVVVTYNRLDKLKTALDCFDAQTFAPEYVLVVDNASTDGTKEYLEAWQHQENAFRKHVITMDSNTGGSGGFHTGLKHAKDMDADWIWVSDDDAFPEEDALEKLNEFIESRTDRNDDISAVCCRVINGGVSAYKHRSSIVQKGFRVQYIFSTDEDYEKEYFEINSFTYVGTVINKKKLLMAGLTRKDYFIWNDDSEHALRLGRLGKIYCVPAAKIHHDELESTAVTWKTYYGMRNSLDLIKNHFPGYVYLFYSLELLARAYAALLIRRDREKYLIYRKALKDCRHGVSGIDEVYRPGWKPKETASYKFKGKHTE